MTGSARSDAAKLRTRCTLTCPRCGHASVEVMPTNACVVFYECPSCGATLRPQPGDCCVFCSYGDVLCPPMQAGARCQR